MIFNVETMKQALLSFEIDLTKMPLGKLSKNQLDKAYKVLTELQTLITMELQHQKQLLSMPIIDFIHEREDCFFLSNHLSLF